MNITKLSTVDKPWGSYTVLSQILSTTVKIIFLKSGHRTSLQLHNHRSEKWFVLDGSGYAELNGKHRLVNGKSIFIPKKEPHRIEASTDLTLLEISYGLFDEEDIIRIEDDYSR